MAKGRYFNTKFWSDTYIADLDPIEKLLYIYFLSNEKTETCGIYELPLKIMSIETGIELSILKKVIKRFEREKKIFHFKGFVILKNFIKNQNLQSEDLRKGILRSFEAIPVEIRIRALLFGYSLDPLGSVGGVSLDSATYLTKLNLTKLNLTKKDMKTYKSFLNQRRKEKGLEPVKFELSDDQKDFFERSKLIPVFKKAVNENLSKSYFEDPDDIEDLKRENSKINIGIKKFWIRCKKDFNKASEVIEYFAGDYGAWCNWKPAVCFRKDTVVDFENKEKPKKNNLTYYND
jgi:hypothetical protein